MYIKYFSYHNSSPYVVPLDQPEKYPFKFKLIIRPMIGRHLDSMYVMEEFLEKECQDLDYTIVRPPRLLDDRMIGMATISLLNLKKYILFRKGSES